MPHQRLRAVTGQTLEKVPQTGFASDGRELRRDRKHANVNVLMLLTQQHHEDLKVFERDGSESGSPVVSKSTSPACLWEHDPG